jgi:hypothetical protein
MLEYTEDSFFEGMEFRPFVLSAEPIAAKLMDEPFMVSNGDAYHAAFAAGDYLCIGVDGPFGMAAEQFVNRYKPAERFYLSTYRMYHNGEGEIYMEPVDD